MKRLITLLLVACISLQPLTATDTQEDNITEVNDYSAFNTNLALVTKHLNKLTSLFKKKPNKGPAVTKQVKNAEKYMNSATAKKAHNLLLDGFPCPAAEEMSAAEKQLVNKALSSMEKFRKTYAQWLHHVNNNLSNCEIAKDVSYMEEAVRPITELADFGYETLYSTLQMEDKMGPTLEEYQK